MQYTLCFVFFCQQTVDTLTYLMSLNIPRAWTLLARLAKPSRVRMRKPTLAQAPLDFCLSVMNVVCQGISPLDAIKGSAVHTANPNRSWPHHLTKNEAASIVNLMNKLLSVVSDILALDYDSCSLRCFCK